MQIQFNGRTIMVKANETEFTSLYNHEAIDTTLDTATRAADGDLIAETSLAKLIRGIANRFEFVTGINFESSRARRYFRAKAKAYVETLPQANIRAMV